MAMTMTMTTPRRCVSVGGPSLLFPGGPTFDVDVPLQRRHDLPKTAGAAAALVRGHPMSANHP